MSESKYGAAETDSGAAVFLFSIGRRRKVVNERLNTALQFIAGATERLDLCRFAAGSDRVVDAPVDSLCRAREDRTLLTGVIADGNHKIEGCVEKLIQGFGSMTRDVDSDLVH